MKRVISRIALASLIAVPNLALAQAQCPNGTQPFPSSGANAITATLTGNMLCVGTSADPNKHWQEFHQSGGALIDFKRGRGHPIDTEQQVGTWFSNDAQSTVTHNYGAGGVFTWVVCRTGGVGNPNPLVLVSTGNAGTVNNVILQSGGPRACP